MDSSGWASGPIKRCLFIGYIIINIIIRYSNVTADILLFGKWIFQFVYMKKFSKLYMLIFVKQEVHVALLLQEIISISTNACFQILLIFFLCISCYCIFVTGLILYLFDLILYVPSTIFQLCRDGSSWAEPVLS